MFEDAYNIIKSASKIPGVSKSLMMPIISSLCVLKLDQIAHDSRTMLEHEKLVGRFVKEAIDNRSPVHIGRALAMEASYFAKLGNLKEAIQDLERLQSMYNVEDNSFDMISEYGRDFAIECYSESVQWYYLQERHGKAQKQADMVIKKFLPLLEDVDADVAMHALFPMIQVIKLLGRAGEAKSMVKKYVIDARENCEASEFWAPLLNPLMYLLEIIECEENDEYDRDILDQMEDWLMREDHQSYHPDMERKAKTILGELCWRLIGLKGDDDPSRDALTEKARELLTPVARYPHNETFLKHTARALIEALDD
jgi:hypothetical protein